MVYVYVYSILWINSIERIVFINRRFSMLLRDNFGLRRIFSIQWLVYYISLILFKICEYHATYREYSCKSCIRGKKKHQFHSHTLSIFFSLFNIYETKNISEVSRGDSLTLMRRLYRKKSRHFAASY